MKQLIFKKLILVTCLLGFALPLQAGELNKPAPDFTLKSLDGNNLKLSEQAGNVILLNFWASWCGPCRKEMPLLNELHNKYQPLGFSVIGLNVEQDTQLAEKFIRERAVDFPILFDPANSVSKKYDVVAMPTTVMIDRNGNMRYLHKGYKEGDEKQYRSMIKQLVRE